MKIYVVVGWNESCPEDGQWCEGVFSSIENAKAYIKEQDDIQEEEGLDKLDPHGFRITEHAIDSHAHGVVIEEG